MAEMTLPLSMILPIMAPLPINRAQRDLQDRALEELRHLRELRPLDPTFGDSMLSIRVVDDPEEEPLLAGIWEKPAQVRQYRILIVEIDAEECTKTIREESDAAALAYFAPEELPSLSEQEAVSLLQLEVNTLLLLANILNPGALSAEAGYVFIGGEHFGSTTPFFAEHLFFAVEASRKLGWPPIIDVDLLQGWTWLRESGALIDGIGVGHIGRALSAVSHLTTQDLTSTNSIDLVWILLGLEALYSKGNVGLKEQLLGKTEALLGPRTDNKKAFGIVYDFRSRFLHGDVDVPLRFTDFTAIKKFEDFHAELSRNEDLALAVLLSTLQWMISHSSKELLFEYCLSDNEASGAN